MGVVASTRGAASRGLCTDAVIWVLRGCKGRVRGRCSFDRGIERSLFVMDLVGWDLMGRVLVVMMFARGGIGGWGLGGGGEVGR